MLLPNKLECLSLLKIFARDKHSRLYDMNISDKEKKLYEIHK